MNAAIGVYTRPATAKRRCQGYDHGGARCEAYTPQPFSFEWSPMGTGPRQNTVIYLCWYHAPQGAETPADA